jgi:hypothetical protein
VRSHTTPNLHKGYRPQQSSFMVPRKPTLKSMPTTSPTGKCRHCSAPWSRKYETAYYLYNDMRTLTC